MLRSKHSPEFRAMVSQEYIDLAGSANFLAAKYGIGCSTLKGQARKEMAIETDEKTALLWLESQK